MSEWRDVVRLYERGDVRGTRAAVRARNIEIEVLLVTLGALGCSDALEGLTGAGSEHGERYGQLETCRACASWIVPSDPQIEAGGWLICCACALDPGLWTCLRCGGKFLRDGAEDRGTCSDCDAEARECCDLAMARLKREGRA